MLFLSCAACIFGPAGHAAVIGLRWGKIINKPAACLLAGGLTAGNVMLVILTLIFLLGNQVQTETTLSGNLIETLLGSFCFTGIGFLFTVVHMAWKDANAQETSATA